MDTISLNIINNDDLWSVWIWRSNGYYALSVVIKLEQ